MSYDEEGRGPGYEGLILMGKTPHEAWQIIRDEMRRDDGQGGSGLEVLRELAKTEEGREALRASAAAWAERGMPPPWDGLVVF